MNIENQIVSYLKEHVEASPNELFEKVGASRQMLHRVLNRLLQENMLEKVGRPPKVFYRIKERTESKTGGGDTISDDKKEFLQQHFNLFTETGNELNGTEAFERWCVKQKLPLQKTVDEYIGAREKYLAYFGNNEFINGTEKLKNTKGFEKVCIDEMFYGDFYAIERFGKTKLGNLIHFAKQGQSKPLMEKICMALKPKIETLIEEMKIDAVGYIPPTIKRELQLMNYMKRSLNLSLPHINIKKVSGIIPVPQKALAKLEERISNARASIVVDDKRNFNKILLIDDAVGSGATINETACKLKLKKMTSTVIGFAVVGSFKGFDVIQEV
jgi:DNA-binding transcriptional ArsR family regulator